MGEPPPSEPEARRVLEEDRRSRRNFISRNLLGYCFKRTRDRARAEDATEEAITLVLSGKGWHRWVHDDGKRRRCAWPSSSSTASTSGPARCSSIACASASRTTVSDEELTRELREAWFADDAAGVRSLG